MKTAVAVSIGILMSLLMATSQGAEDAKNKFTVEVETFKLTAAKIVDIKDSKGAKGVLFTNEKSRAETKVKLTKGRWIASLYMIAGETDEEDAVYLEFAGQLSRLYDNSGGQYEANVTDYDSGDPDLELEDPIVDIKKDGKYKIVLKCAEPNVTLDRIVFEKQKRE